MRLTITLLLVCCFIFTGFAQKIMQIETYGKAKTHKIFIGQSITYQLEDSKDWQYAVIEDYIVDQGLIQTALGYVKIDDIKAFRFDRRAIRTLGSSLYIFGVAWSGFALIGYATDGNPDTKYSALDASVTGTALVTGFIISKFFRYKKIKFGKRKRLRMLEIPIDGE